jgi:hypothetical protein
MSSCSGTTSGSPSPPCPRFYLPLPAKEWRVILGHVGSRNLEDEDGERVLTRSVKATLTIEIGLQQAGAASKTRSSDKGPGTKDLGSWGEVGVG